MDQIGKALHLALHPQAQEGGKGGRGDAEAAASVPEVPKRHRMCGNARCCLCVGEGFQLLAFKKSLDTELVKPAAPESSDDRTALKEGKWMIAFHGQAFRELVGPLLLAQEYEERPVFLHMAYQLLSPWRTSWHELSITDAPHGEPPASENRLYTKVLWYELMWAI